MWMRYTVSIARQCGRSIPRRQPAGADKVPTPLAARTRDIAPFHVMDLLARARALEAAGRSIIHMEIGEPDFPTPAPVIAAGIRALRDGRTHYTPALGLPALREAISDFYRNRHGVAVAPERIVVTQGASGALQLALAAQVAAQWLAESVAALLSSPANPTGTRIDPAELARISVAVESRGGRLVVDGIYQGMVYAGVPSATALEM